MDKISSYKKTKIEPETIEEYYLNPKDMINNDKIYDSTQIDLMIYLPLNELLIVTFEENIAVIDIKRTISSNFTIIKMINHSEMHKTVFSNQDDKKNKVPTSNEYFSSFCFKMKENDLRKIKNLIAVEKKSNLNELYLVIEYMNLDLIVIKFDNVFVQSIYQVIYTHTKSFFVQYNKMLKMNYESLMILNYISKLYGCEDLIFSQIENCLFVHQLGDVEYTLLTVIKIDMIIKNFMCFKEDKLLIITTVDMNNIIKVNYYTMFKLIKTESLTEENEGNVTLMKYLTYSNTTLFIYAQLNHIVLYTFDLKMRQMNKMNTITFNLFEDWAISYCFLLCDYIYIFNSNGDYSYEKIDKKENSMIQSLNISRQIYAIADFQINIGLFILSTQNTIRLTNVNITYFIPKQLSQQMSLKKLIKRNQENKDSFYTFSLCEFLIFYLRFHMNHDKMIIDNNKGDNEEIKSIIEKRLEIYYDQIYDKNKKEALIDIIDYYQNTNDITKKKYKAYLNNPKYTCDFCSNTLSSYQNDIYQCKNNHQTFSCCITQLPFNEEFYYCLNCKLFYEKNFKICLICQQMLSHAL